MLVTSSAIKPYRLLTMISFIIIKPVVASRNVPPKVSEFVTRIPAIISNVPNRFVPRLTVLMIPRRHMVLHMAITLSKLTALYILNAGIREKRSANCEHCCLDSPRIAMICHIRIIVRLENNINETVRSKRLFVPMLSIT